MRMFCVVLPGEGPCKPCFVFIRSAYFFQLLLSRRCWFLNFQRCEFLRFDGGRTDGRRWRKLPVYDRRNCVLRQSKRLHQFLQWITFRSGRVRSRLGCGGRLRVNIAPGFLSDLVLFSACGLCLFALLLGLLNDPVHQADKPDDDENDELFHGGTRVIAPRRRSVRSLRWIRASANRTECFSSADNP